MTYLVGASSRCSTWLLRGQMSAFGLPKSLQLKPLGLQAPKPPSAQEPAAYGASEKAAVPRVEGGGWEGWRLVGVVGAEGAGGQCVHRSVSGGRGRRSAEGMEARGVASSPSPSPSPASSPSSSCRDEGSGGVRSQLTDGRERRQCTANTAWRGRRRGVGCGGSAQPRHQSRPRPRPPRPRPPPAHESTACRA